LLGAKDRSIKPYLTFNVQCEKERSLRQIEHVSGLALQSFGDKLQNCRAVELFGMRVTFRSESFVFLSHVRK